MNYLIGDIGNTNIKICKINKKFKIVKTYLFETRDPSLVIKFKKKLNIILRKKINNKILFSSVVPKVYKKISKSLREKKFKVYEIKKFNLKKIMKYKVNQYSQLGSDRIANSIGAYYKFYSNCIVIDFGTATTFDVIKNKAIYDGGVIAPGIKLSIENLFSSTALLPMFKLKKYPKNYGKNTKEALSSGFFWGYEGLINNIIKKIIKKNGKSFKIILTGGYSYLFKNRLIRQVKIENDITMQGIIKVYKDFLI
tara:strand:- start:6061 stop:6819 length:759 start_codon:yes stop_codon:yes gene_type:complete